MTSSFGSYESSQQDAAQRLQAAAAEFRRSIEQAMTHLVDAAGKLVTASDGLAAAVAEARSYAERAEAAQARMEESFGNLSQLTSDLQERLGALAILARPLPTEARAEEQPAPPEEPPPAPSW